MNKGHSEQDLFGTWTHYDEHGHKIGKSEPRLFGGYDDYDAEGHKIGHSDPTLSGGYVHYDKHGRETGRSDPLLGGGFNHYDSRGKLKGSSDPKLFGGFSHKNSGGCYVATCVYGSYDCPQVWTLRRYRDRTLTRHFFGRLFIGIYYATSPTVVRLFGSDKVIRRIWEKLLNKWVSRLQEAGYESTPYRDANDGGAGSLQ